jgi:hypothetical protein
MFTPNPCLQRFTTDRSGEVPWPLQMRLNDDPCIQSRGSAGRDRPKCSLGSLITHTRSDKPHVRGAGIARRVRIRYVAEIPSGPFLPDGTAEPTRTPAQLWRAAGVLFFLIRPALLAARALFACVMDTACGAVASRPRSTPAHEGTVALSIRIK